MKVSPHCKLSAQLNCGFITDRIVPPGEIWDT